MKKVIIILFTTILIFASEYGQIVGKVVDKKTGEPLSGAIITVQETEIRTVTDENGEYIIPFLRAGTYVTLVNAISYDVYEYLNVQVRSDKTTVLNLAMRPHIINEDSHVLNMKEQLIDFSQTSSSQTIISEEIERLPVTTIDELIRIQPGIVESELGLHMRGGDADEMVYYVDGIATSASVNLSAVEEIQVISSGFDAEYGDALSGVVNIVTKNRRELSGNACYLTDEMLSENKSNFGYNQYDLSLGGPITSRFRYFFSGDFMLTDAFQEALYKIPSPRNDYHIMGKIQYLFPKGNITIAGFKSREQYVVWTPYTEPGNNLKYFENKPMTRTKNWAALTTWDYMLSPKTLASIKIGVNHFDKCYGNRDYEWEQENNRKWYDDYRFKAEHLIDYLLEGRLLVREVLIDSVMQYHEECTTRDVDALRNSPYGIEGIFYTYGDYPEWIYWNNNDMQIRTKITQSIGKNHELKMGIDYTHYDLKFYNNALPWVTNPFWDYYERTPYKFAGYLQGEIHIARVVTRLGARFNYFNANIPDYWPWWRWPYYPEDTLVSKTNFNISPRFGVAFPITDGIKFHFNYSHFYQPQTYLLPEHQKIVMFDFGSEIKLLKDLTFGFTTYFKTIYELVQVRPVYISFPWDYYYEYFITDRANVNGFEFDMQQNIFNTLTLGITYNLQFARYSEWDYYSTINGTDSSLIDIWLDHHEGQTLNARLVFELPENFGFFLLQDFTTSFVISFHSGHPYTLTDLKGNIIGAVNDSLMPGYWNINCKFSRGVKIGPAKLVLTGLIFNLLNTEQIIDVYNTTGSPDDHGIPDPSLSQFIYIAMSSSRYSPQTDHNHDGLISPVEMRDEYIAARDDLCEDPTNYKSPFRFRIGIGVEF